MNPTPAKQLQDIMQEIQTLCGMEAYGIVNMMLLKAASKVETLPADKLITYARTPFPFKEKLPAWKMYVETIYTEFKNRGLDADKLTTGLR